MSVAWPSVLPQRVDKESFQYNPKSGIIRTEMEAGIHKVRRRFTGVTKDYLVSRSMTPEQFSVFEQWFYNPSGHMSLPGVAGGIGYFTFPEVMWFAGEGEDDSDRPNMVVRFLIASGGVPYSATPDGETRDWKVSFTLERTP